MFNNVGSSPGSQPVQKTAAEATVEIISDNLNFFICQYYKTVYLKNKVEYKLKILKNSRPIREFLNFLFLILNRISY